MKCQCNTELIWGGDDMYEDYGIEGQGIVSNLSCPNEDCLVEGVNPYSKLNKEQE